VIKAVSLVNLSPATGKLAEVSTIDDELYPFNYDRLRVDRDIQITSQVKIVHPTPEVRLPYLGYHKNPQGLIEKQLWHLKSQGGTGNYNWKSDDESIALVKNSYTKDIGELRGNNLGDTLIMVSDSLNPSNYDTIPVFVTKIGLLTWLEERIETPNRGYSDFIHLQAYDTDGKKYTNCSSLIYNLELKDEDRNILKLIPISKNWVQIGDFIHNNLDLIKLKHRFDENIDISYVNELPADYAFDQELELHNNFGICSSREYSTKSEGLARVTVSLPINHDRKVYQTNIESDACQIASYNVPVTYSPDYQKFFEDLYTPKKEMQQRKQFTQYYKDDVFKISYGSSLYWVFNGGTNYWPDDIYSIQSK
jgi:hypothetical protein